MRKKTGRPCQAAASIRTGLPSSGWPELQRHRLIEFYVCPHLNRVSR